MDRPWLVTGATGMLGSRFVAKASSKCVALVRRKANLPCETIEGFISEPASIEDAVRKISPAICIHFAACTNLLQCEQDPDLAHQLNVQASKTIASVCANVGARVIYMCTDSIFDGKKGNYTEDDEPRPINAYADSKLQGERAVLTASSDNISIRGNIFGKENDSTETPKLYEWALRKLKCGEQMVGFDDVFFNPLTVESLSEIILKMVRLNLPGGCWHVGTTNAISKDAFIRLIAKTNGLSDKAVLRGRQQDLNLQPPRPLNTSLLTLKLQSFGIPLPSIEQELKSLKDQP